MRNNFAGRREYNKEDAETSPSDSSSDNTLVQDTNPSVNNEYTILFLMQGVIHSEGMEPLFKANISYPDGSVKDVSLKLGDVILGDWKAKEYNQYTKKLTISNGERLLVLEAGRQVTSFVEFTRSFLKTYSLSKIVFIPQVNS